MTFEKLEGGKAKDPKVEVLKINSIEQIAKMYVDVKKERDDLKKERDEALLRNQELESEVARLTRNEKCYGCGHNRENHDSSGCLVWVEADAHRKCLCKVWTATERRDVSPNDTCIPKPTGRALQYCSEYEKTSHDHSPTCSFWVKERKDSHEPEEGTKTSV